ncbi:Thioredoxin [Erythrobacter litoralis]|uniref:Protein-disulfide isomerase n=1 Tax=Erythrobacter litoralis TaxID=39960 RepID=A0A074MHV6_9SPHN|nr:thioredoxin domain-containing protein [Erythrobacter litoralis]AOL23081.1 Thioredoxin [Erythrobacter litoralis]KEO93054.1 protein-disulfide isomerase [Erythrobacter litoralis]
MRTAFVALSAGLAAGLAVLAAPAAAQNQDLSNPDSNFVDTTPTKVWQAEIAQTERGHLIGNPEAEAQLIEFMSYTCPHCAEFAKEAGPSMDLVLIAPGKLGVEVRPVIRNWLDMTVSLLVQCGDVAGFKDRHRLFLYTQDEWLGRAANAPRSQQAAWARGDAAARLSAARALDLDDTLAKKGMSLSEIDACLSDDAAAKRIAQNSLADKTDLGIPGTPSFALDGELLDKVHSWGALRGVLAARYAPAGAPAAGE